MAKETITRLIDDLDGSAAERTVVFAWDGRGYELDLSKKNIAGFEKALKPYLASARSSRVTPNAPRKRTRRAAATTTRRGNLAEMRQWARSNGFEVSDRGRVSNDIVQAFDAAQ